MVGCHFYNGLDGIRMRKRGTQKVLQPVISLKQSKWLAGEESALPGRPVCSPPPNFPPYGRGTEGRFVQLIGRAPSRR